MHAPHRALAAAAALTLPLAFVGTINAQAAPARPAAAQARVLMAATTTETTTTYAAPIGYEPVDGVAFSVQFDAAYDYYGTVGRDPSVTNAGGEHPIYVLRVESATGKVTNAFAADMTDPDYSAASSLGELSPDGRYVRLVTNAQQRVGTTIYDTATAKYFTLQAPNNDISSVFWSADSTEVAYLDLDPQAGYGGAKMGQSTLYVLDLATGTVKTVGTQVVQSVSISNGSNLVVYTGFPEYVSNPDPNGRDYIPSSPSQVYAYNLSTGTTTQITNFTGSTNVPSGNTYSPRGEQLFAVSADQDRSIIYGYELNLLGAVDPLTVNRYDIAAGTTTTIYQMPADSPLNSAEYRLSRVTSNGRYAFFDRYTSSATTPVRLDLVTGEVLILPISGYSFLEGGCSYSYQSTTDPFTIISGVTQTCNGSTVTPTPTVTPSPSTSPTSTPTPTPSQSPTSTPTKRPTVRPTPTKTPTVRPTPTKRPTPTPTHHDR